MDTLPQTFIEYVQHHERIWGNDHYHERPTLEAMLNAHIIVFWQKSRTDNVQDRRFMVTIHDTLQDIEDYYTRLVFRANVEQPSKRIHRIFRDKKRIRVTSVKVEIEFTEDD